MRPTTEEFEQHLPAFLVSNPEPKCAKGGHAAYAQVTENIACSADFLRTSAQSCPPRNSIVRQLHDHRARPLYYLFASAFVLNIFYVDEFFARSDVFMSVTVKNAVFWDTKSQFVQKTHYFTTEPRPLMLCKISGFHGGDYKESRLLGCDTVWLLQ
jgi:hypothetical protein